MSHEQAINEERVLVLAPTSADRNLTRSILAEAGIECRICADLSDLVEQMRVCVGAILLTEDVLVMGDVRRLVEVLQAQPRWSDLPIILLSATAEESAIAAWTVQQLGNVTVLERPVRLRTMVSTLRSAIRARRRQYELRDQVEALKRSEEALRVADRRKDEFLAMLAHELRNPLAPIRTGLQVIQLSGGYGDTAPDTLQMMDRQLRQLVRLIDDLLDISRITSGNVELRREPCELGTVLSMAIEGARPVIEDAAVDLTVSTPRHHVNLDADPARLSQVFSNLLTNAAKYTERGGHIWLSAEQHAADVVVSVRDNGIGIRPEMLPQIFEMFTQVDKGERSHGGLGIGLSLVRALVEMHDGTVEGRSDGLGQGSEFVVRLPIVHHAEDVRQPSSAPTSQHGGGHRVLVVDDNRDAATTLSMMLRLMGNDVRTAYDGLEALATSEEFRPELVLLDLGMPKLNGFEAAQRIREQPWGQDLTLVALTGWAQDEDRRRSRDAGFDDHLVKPVDRNELTNLLASLALKSGLS